MIREISISNFKSHKNTKLNFSEGNNILIGISGSGKSTILDAICFALYGTFPKLQQKKVKLDELIMNKPAVEDKAEIRLSFSVNNRLYEIVRKIHKGHGTYAEIRENNILKATTTKQATEFVEKLLKIDYELFSKIIYSEQNNLDYFLGIQRGDRIKKIDELLDLDKFENVRKISINFRNKYRYLSEERQKVLLSYDEENLIKEKNEIENELNKIKKQIEELNNKIKILSEEEKSKSEEILKKEKLKNEITKLRNRKIELEKGISIYTEELKNLPVGDLKKILKEYSEAESEFKKMQKEEEERKLKLRELAIKSGNLSKKIEEKKKILEFIENFDFNKFENIEKELRESEKQLISKKFEIEKLEGSITNLKSAKGICPVCDSELSEEKIKELLNLKTKKLKELENTSINLEAKIKNLKDEYKKEKELNYKAKFFKHKLAQIGDVEEEFQKLQTEIKTNEDKKIDVDIYKEKFEKIKHIKENLEKRTEVEIKIEKYKKLLTEVEKQLSEVEFDEYEFNKLKEKLEKIKIERHGYMIELKNKKDILSEKEKRLFQLNKEIKILEENKKEIEFLKYAANALNTFSVNLGEIQEILRREFVENLNEVMNIIWQDVYPYEDFIGIRFKIDDKDYLLQLYDLKNKWINVEGISSGGERSIASLVMRIALAIVLSPNLKLLILDEPTHNLDTNIIEKLSEVLREKVGNLLEQTIIVTHDERLTYAGTGYIYELYREEGKKGYTKVKKI